MEPSLDKQDSCDTTIREHSDEVEIQLSQEHTLLSGNTEKKTAPTSPTSEKRRQRRRRLVDIQSKVKQYIEERVDCQNPMEGMS